jgi:hypothetical protein
MHSCNGYYYNYNCNSTWYSWGRWVFFVVAVIVILIVAFLFSYVPSLPSLSSPTNTFPRCLNNRRRRRRGLNPMYGTGWLPYSAPKYNNNGGVQPQNEQQPYYNNQPYNGGAAPPYQGQTGPIGYQQTGNTFSSNEGYYGHENAGHGGIELQHPQSAYQPQRGGDPVYEAPPYAPPGKGYKGQPDAVIR